jgi:putative transposase
VADRLVKSLRGVIVRKKAGIKAGFPRFKPIERMKSFTYPQFGFRLGERLVLSGLGSISIKKHRQMQGKTKILTIKKTPSGKWFAIFTTDTEKVPSPCKNGPAAGLDLGVEQFAYLSNGEVIENPRHLGQAEEHLKETHRQLSSKKKGSKNRQKAKHRLVIAYEKLTNRRRDFLHKTSRRLVNAYSFLALENLNVAGLAGGYLAKSVLDCSWAEFIGMIRYKAEDAGCDVGNVAAFPSMLKVGSPTLTSRTGEPCPHLSEVQQLRPDTEEVACREVARLPLRGINAPGPQCGDKHTQQSYRRNAGRSSLRRRNHYWL